MTRHLPALWQTMLFTALLTTSPVLAEDQGRSISESDPETGRTVFRFETFGNEGFWTDAMRLPQGIMAEKLTLRDLLEVGLHIDSEALGREFTQKLIAETKSDLSPKQAPLMNDPELTGKLVQIKAVIGVVPVDSDGDGKMDLKKGDKLGVSCAICHTVTDGSVYSLPGKGSIGKRLDGRATHSLDLGNILATAANSRAYYPNLQLELGGKTIGRAPTGIRPDSTEAEVDAYLKNDKFYPRGTFDDTQDGIGNPVQNTPLFRQDLAAPYGSSGLHEKFEGITNASFTTNLDLTTMATPEGGAFLKTLGGKAGEELHQNYVTILKETGVEDFPFVKAERSGKVGHRDTPVGLQVDMQKLLDLKAYTFSLQAPPGAAKLSTAATQGMKLFAANCTTCHNADPDDAVSAEILPFEKVWPGYEPKAMEKRKMPLSPITDSKGIYDDKAVIVDASERGEKRGVALPLLLDLARKPALLHDNSVATLDELLDPMRGAEAPHPFYVEDRQERAAMTAFLKQLSAR